MSATSSTSPTENPTSNGSSEFAQKTWLYLFGCLPLLKVKSKKGIRKYLLFGFLPVCYLVCSGSQHEGTGRKWRFYNRETRQINDCKVTKYRLMGMPLMVRTSSPTTKKLKLLGMRVYRHKRRAATPLPPQGTAPLQGESLDMADLFRQPVQQKTQTIEQKGIDIVVPVYNGFSYLEPLFASLRAHTDLPYHLVVVNDASPDARVLPLLKEWQVRFGDAMELIDNEKNLGFIGSVNTALKRTSRHVVLVNTDVVLPSRWASRLLEPIFQDERVAAVTPFSNSATIYSLPAIGDNNFDDELEKVNALLAPLQIPYEKLHLPTGVGFCMAMNRRALDELGGLDEIFGKGYGEECDWCQRAIRAGYYHTVAGNLFVRHKHGASFLAAEKQQLLERNASILLQRYPDYDADVQHTLQNRAFLSLRFVGELLYLSAVADEVQVWFDLAWGGGTEVYTQNKFEELKEKALLVRVQTDGKDNLTLSWCYQHCHNKYTLQEEDAYVLLSHLPVRLIVLNHLAGYRDVLESLERITWLKQQTGARVSFRGHDLMCICPNINMLNAEKHYCACTGTEDCARCFEKMRGATLLPAPGIRQWHRVWQHFLELTADDIIVFSDSTRKLFCTFYPLAESKIQVIPHSILPLKKASVARHKGINIVVYGAIGPHKGLAVVKEACNMLSRFPGTTLSVVGYVPGGMPEGIRVTGAYKPEEVPGIMESLMADIVWIPSIWPETFSYTTAEAMAMGLPVACFDLGAPAERVSQYDKGLILSDIDAETALREMTRFVSALRGKQTRKGRKKKNEDR